MSVSMDEVSASGVRSFVDALAMAVGFSELFEDTTFVVVEVRTEKVFDVERAYPADCIGAFGVVAMVRNGAEIQDQIQGLG